MFEYQYDKQRFKAKDLLIKTVITIVVIFIIALAFSGCAKPQQANLEIKEICQDGHVYKIYGYSKKEILIENGEFKSCDNGQIEF